MVFADDCHVVTPMNLLFSSRFASGCERVLFTFPTLFQFPVYQLMKFSFISFHHFASWINKKNFSFHSARASSCILKMLILFSFPFSASILPNRRIIVLWKTEMKLDTCWWWWGLMKWFHSTFFSTSLNDETSFVFFYYMLNKELDGGKSTWLACTWVVFMCAAVTNVK